MQRRESSRRPARGGGASWATLVLALASPAAAHPWSARDAVGGTSLSDEWQCRIGDGSPTACRDLSLPAGRKRVSVKLERIVRPAAEPSGSIALSLGHFATPTTVSIDG